jgi:hypothetical protein
VAHSHPADSPGAVFFFFLSSHLFNRCMAGMMSRGAWTTFCTPPFATGPSKMSLHEAPTGKQTDMPQTVACWVVTGA